MKYDVFISYRRKGGDKSAELLKLALCGKLIQEDRIFMDTHAMYNTENFQQHIEEAIRQSSNFIIVLSKGCFDQKRENDIMLLEIETAIAEKKNVIPVFFDGCNSFSDYKLPESIKVIERMNAVRYDHEYTEAFYQKLISFLDDVNSELIEPKHNNIRPRFKLSIQALGCTMTAMLMSLTVILIIEIPYSLDGNEMALSPNMNRDKDERFQKENPPHHSLTYKSNSSSGELEKPHNRENTIENAIDLNLVNDIDDDIIESNEFPDYYHQKFIENIKYSKIIAAVRTGGDEVDKAIYIIRKKIESIDDLLGFVGTNMSNIHSLYKFGGNEKKLYKQRVRGAYHAFMYRHRKTLGDSTSLAHYFENLTIYDSLYVDSSYFHSKEYRDFCDNLRTYIGEVGFILDEYWMACESDSKVHRYSDLYTKYFDEFVKKARSLNNKETFSLLLRYKQKYEEVLKKYDKAQEYGLFNVAMNYITSKLPANAYCLKPIVSDNNDWIYLYEDSSLSNIVDSLDENVIQEISRYYIIRLPLVQSCDSAFKITAFIKDGEGIERKYIPKDFFVRKTNNENQPLWQTVVLLDESTGDKILQEIHNFQNSDKKVQCCFSLWDASLAYLYGDVKIDSLGFKEKDAMIIEIGSKVGDQYGSYSSFHSLRTRRATGRKMLQEQEENIELLIQTYLKIGNNDCVYYWTPLKSILPPRISVPTKDKNRKKKKKT